MKRTDSSACFSNKFLMVYVTIIVLMRLYMLKMVTGLFGGLIACFIFYVLHFLSRPNLGRIT